MLVGGSCSDSHVKIRRSPILRLWRFASVTSHLLAQIGLTYPRHYSLFQADYFDRDRVSFQNCRSQAYKYHLLYQPTDKRKLFPELFPDSSLPWH